MGVGVDSAETGGEEEVIPREAGRGYFPNYIW